MSRDRTRVALFLIAVLATVGLASAKGESPASEPPPVTTDATDPFPMFEAVRANVGFWTRVFGEWSLGQVAVHDLEYPGLVYEVVDLPGPVEERYTEEQIDFIEDLNELWQERLKTVARKVAAGDALDDDEKGWVLAITTTAGTDRIADADERVRTQRGLRERFRRGIEISYRYDDRIRQIFSEAGLPEDLAYLPHVESSFQARARSSAGAVGVWQFTRGTGKLYLSINSAIDQRLDPIAAAYGAAAYLRDAYAKLGDWPIALTSYNHGVVGMSRAVKKHGTDYEEIFLEYQGRTFGFASKNFYAEFLAARDIAGAPDTFFPEGFRPESPLAYDEIRLESRTTPGRIAKAYDVPVEELAAVNPAWSRRAVRSGLALPKNTLVWLPEGTLDRLAGEGREPDYTLAGWIDTEGEYVVQPGDSLSLIAETYGVRLSALRRLNGMEPTDSLIHPGQRLRLSAALEQAVHIVKRGENLSTIARKHRMSLTALRRLNGIPPNESLVRVGQRLRVTGSEASQIHIVRRGETLLRIALAYGVRLTDLLSLNRLNERSIIHPGQAIKIPIR